MALEINAIRDYLISVGCKIEYPILINAFKQHLYNPDPAVQGKLRTQFKDYVNRLATVSLENNMKFILLRPEFRPKLDQQKLEKQPQTTEPDSSPQQIHDMKPRAPLKEHREDNLTPQLPKPIAQQSRPQIARPMIQQESPHSPRTTIIQQNPPPVPQHRVCPKVSSPSAHHRQHSFPQTHIQSQQLSSYQQSQMQPPIQSMKGQQQHTERLNNFTVKQHDATDGDSSMMPPPRPPPRRRQSTASLFKPSKSFDKSLIGRVREHALKFSSPMSSSSIDLNSSIPKRNSSMRENRLSRDSTFVSVSSALQRNGSHVTTRSRSSQREDESDSSSLQPMDPLRRKWTIESCSCNYNGLLALLQEDSSLASYRDIISGYTALHWAAKFGNLNIIKLIAGTYQVSANIKSSSGQTALHVAYMFNRIDAANLLLESYNANANIRDHSGRKPMQYLHKTIL